MSFKYVVKDADLDRLTVVVENTYIDVSVRQAGEGDAMVCLKPEQIKPLIKALLKARKIAIKEGRK